METTAGQGNDIGSRFQHLGYLLQALRHSPRLGVCVDTCHIFAAGYDLRTAKTYEATWNEFDESIGLDRLKAFHLNDSKFPLGSGRDRHEVPGKGHIGEAGFRRLVRDKRFRDLPGITELKESLTAEAQKTLRRLVTGK